MARVSTHPRLRSPPKKANIKTTMTDLSVSVQSLAEYRPAHKVRFVTAAALFDGHDAAINIMRRILQSRGAEVIDHVLKEFDVAALI